MLPRPSRVVFAALIAALLSAGCAGVSTPLGLFHSKLTSAETFCCDGGARLDDAQAVLARAHAAKILCREECVDLYFRAASLAWYAAADQSVHAIAESPQANAIYRDALYGLINQGEHFGRWIRGQGLRICTDQGEVLLPVECIGPLWQFDEFDHLTAVDDNHAKGLDNYYRCHGVGVTAVGIRHRRNVADDQFSPRNRYASATILMRPVSGGNSESDGPMVIEVHDPLRSKNVEIGGEFFPLASDYSAPITTAMGSYTTTDVFRAFLQPGQTQPDESGLFTLERYQPGKIPVIVIHGLLSDRFTWANFVNEVRVQTDLMDRFQFWSYQYPTGEPFLQSAARLRRDLDELRDLYDPSRSDAALDQTMIVGHSMGGLIAKLQVISTGDTLWRSIASRPMDQLTLSPSARDTLTELFYFQPSPMVSRVVFIGTPHRGSAFAQRAIGRFGALLVREPEELRRRQRQVVEANPGVFSDEFSRRFPTSIDLLNPSSSLLQAIGRLNFEPAVSSHSIIGNWRPMIGNGLSDGIVPVDSARIDQVNTELVVHQKHTGLTNDPAVIAEVMRIMREHAVADMATF
jgi:pimeloyl-ACP methyl ester carboxylesterase